MVVSKRLPAPPVSSRFWFPGSRYVPERDLFVRRVYGTTVLAPPEGPYVLQGPATDVEANKLRHTPASYRRMLDASLSSRQGVVYTRGTCQDLKVNATGVPDGLVHVVTGHAYVRGTQATPQGMYHLYNDATLDINVLGPNPAHATLDRIDLVVARIQDSFYSGANDLPTIEMVTGTPAGSPAVPAAPANSLILAQLSIIHASATIPQSVITDRRVPAGNGIIVLDDILVGTDSRYLTAAAQITFLNTGGGTTNLIPPGLAALEVEWLIRGTQVASLIAVWARINNLAAGYDNMLERASAAAWTVTEGLNQAQALVGNAVAGSGTVGYFGAGAFRIRHPAGAGGKQILAESSASPIDTAGNQEHDLAQSKLRTLGPLTRLDVLPSLGSIDIGSRLILKGVVGIQP